LFGQVDDPHAALADRRAQAGHTSRAAPASIENLV
jgi:hypothetical protein